MNQRHLIFNLYRAVDLERLKKINDDILQTNYKAKGIFSREPKEIRNHLWLSGFNTFFLFLIPHYFHFIIIFFFKFVFILCCFVHKEIKIYFLFFLKFVPFSLKIHIVSCYEKSLDIKSGMS
jgi:hypothetical protein